MDSTKHSAMHKSLRFLVEEGDGIDIASEDNRRQRLLVGRENARRQAMLNRTDCMDDSLRLNPMRTNVGTIMYACGHVHFDLEI